MLCTLILNKLIVIQIVMPFTDLDCQNGIIKINLKREKESGMELRYI